MGAKLKNRIWTAIENRLATKPHQYDEPLRKTLQGYWKLRVSDYYAAFMIVGEEVRNRYYHRFGWGCDLKKVSQVSIVEWICESFRQPLLN